MRKKQPVVGSPIAWAMSYASGAYCRHLPCSCWPLPLATLTRYWSPKCCPIWAPKTAKDRQKNTRGQKCWIHYTYIYIYTYTYMIYRSCKLRYLCLSSVPQTSNCEVRSAHQLICLCQVLDRDENQTICIRWRVECIHSVRIVFAKRIYFKYCMWVCWQACVRFLNRNKAYSNTSAHTVKCCWARQRQE